MIHLPKLMARMKKHKTGSGDSSLQQASACLQAGGIIAYPTEAVYGLGCDPRNLDALQRLLAIKQRDPAKGLILIADNIERLLPFISITDEQRLTLMQSWPGPYTWLVPVQEGVSKYLTGQHETLAVRVTAHPLVAALCEQAKMPLISTSANLAGQPPARNAQDVSASLGDQIDYLLEGELGGEDAPSSIRDLKTGRIIRNN